MTSAFLYTTEFIVRPGSDTDNGPILDISTLTGADSKHHLDDILGRSS